MNMFQRIDTVFLNVKDLAKSIDWYTKTLGLTVRWRDDDGGYAALNISETPLTLRRITDNTEFVPTTEASFNFFVAEPAVAHQYLKESGVEVGEIGSDGGNVTWFWFKDIDGNRLEVCSF